MTLTPEKLDELEAMRSDLLRRLQLDKSPSVDALPFATACLEHLPDLIAAARSRLSLEERVKKKVDEWMSTAAELRRLARGVPSEAARTYMDCAERLERTADELLAILESEARHE